MYLNSLLADYAFDKVEPVLGWVTVGIVAAVLVIALVLFALRNKFAAKFAKYAGIGTVLYLLCVGIVMLALQLAKRMNSGYLDDKWLNHDVIPFVIVPLLALFGFALLAGIALFALSLARNKKAFKVLAIISSIVIIAGMVVSFILIAVYYSRHIAEDGYYNSDSSKVNQIALYAGAGALAVLAVVFALVGGRNDKSPLDSRCIALAGICIGMSFALSYVKLFELPQGGSVTFASLLPLMIFAYIYGPKKGVLAAFIYGLMQAMQDPYIIHPAQFLLDYPIAFAFIGIAGLFANCKGIALPQLRFALGAVAAGVFRFASHVLSGVFAFGVNAGTQNVWLYSMAYNSFVFVDIAIVIVLGVFVFSSKAFLRETKKYNPSLL